MASVTMDGTFHGVGVGGKQEFECRIFVLSPKYLGLAVHNIWFAKYCTTIYHYTTLYSDLITPSTKGPTFSIKFTVAHGYLTNKEAIGHNYSN